MMRHGVSPAFQNVCHSPRGLKTHGRLAGWEAYLESARRMLVRRFAPCDRDEALLDAAVGHALEFDTWASLVRHGLDDAAAVELMHRLISSSESSSPCGPSGRGRGSAEPPALPLQVARRTGVRGRQS